MGVSQFDLMHVALSSVNQPSIASRDENSEAAHVVKMDWTLSIAIHGRWEFCRGRDKVQHFEEKETRPPGTTGT
jgi:hypothetical protein